MNLKKYLLIFPCLLVSAFAAEENLDTLDLGTDFPLLTRQEMAQISINGDEYQQAYNEAENLQNLRMMPTPAPASPTHPHLVDSPLGLEDHVAVVRKADELRREVFPFLFNPAHIPQLKKFFESNQDYLKNSKILFEFQEFLPDEAMILPILTELLVKLQDDLNKSIMNQSMVENKIERHSRLVNIEINEELEAQAIWLIYEIDTCLSIIPIVRNLILSLS